MKLIFTCGGTAGHINPAIGVAQKIMSLYPDTEILFVGAEHMMETELVPKAGFRIITIPVGNLSRSKSLRGIWHNIVSCAKLIAGIRRSGTIMKQFSPDAVIGTGGYVCYPVLKAASARKIPTLVHESNAVPGLTTRMLSKFVDCVMVGMESAAMNYPEGVHAVYTGTPVRSGFSSNSLANTSDSGKKPLVLSFWGSLGADYMNAIISEMIPFLREDRSFSLIHVTGKRCYDSFCSTLPDSVDALSAEGIEIRDYLFDMDRVMCDADLVLCRCGASTLSELAFLGKPAVLVPSPNVTNAHQEKNARVFSDAGAAKLLLEGNFDAKSLYNMIETVLNDPAGLAVMSDRMRALSVPDSVDRIIKLIISYAEGKA